MTLVKGSLSLWHSVIDKMSFSVQFVKPAFNREAKKPNRFLNPCIWLECVSLHDWNMNMKLMVSLWLCESCCVWEPL